MVPEQKIQRLGTFSKVAEYSIGSRGPLEQVPLAPLQDAKYRLDRLMEYNNGENRDNAGNPHCQQALQRAVEDVLHQHWRIQENWLHHFGRDDQVNPVHDGASRCISIVPPPSTVDGH